MIIYLAGPIDDVTEQDSKSWREKIATLAPSGLVFYSPAHAYFNVSMTIAREVDHMNRVAISHSDGMIANLQGPGRAFGTIREIEFARGMGKPVVILGDIRASMLSWDVRCVDTMTAAIDILLEHHSQPKPQVSGMTFMFGVPPEERPE